jgi:tetratricopeptide (TPR) repeat protein
MNDDEARAYFEEGIDSYQNGDFARAQDALTKAAAAFADAQNQRGEAAALTNLGAVYAGNGLFEAAISALERAVELHRATGEREGLAMAIFSLATTLVDSGRRFRPQPWLDEAGRLMRERGNDALADQAKQLKEWLATVVPSGLTEEEQAAFDERSAQVKNASGLAMVAYRLGNYAQAINHWRTA